jgi:hypothetical protein
MAHYKSLSHQRLAILSPRGEDLRLGEEEASLARRILVGIRGVNRVSLF